MNKKCRRCEESKPLASFSKDKSRKDGLQSLCKQCDSRKGRKYYNANKEKIGQKNQKYNRLRLNWNRYRRVKRKYNLSDFEYDSLLINQESTCAICKKKDLMFLAVDHDHNCCGAGSSCGKCVRGLLCKNCNWGLGAFDDNIENMLRAIDYLMNYEANK
jgi:hypothetical protein